VRKNEKKQQQLPRKTICDEKTTKTSLTHFTSGKVHAHQTNRVSI